MDLQCVVSGCPCNTGTKQLCHTCFEVAAAAFVLFAGREVGQLARDHDFDRHHCQFGCHTWEVDQRLAELLAILRVFHALIQRGLRDADGAGGGLDAGRFKRLHQLLEAFALFHAQKVLAFDFEVIEIERVFLHAAIAEDFNLATRNAGVLPRRFVGAGGLFGKEHGQSLVVGCVRNSAGQNGHHMSTGGMGDPRLVAVDDPIAIFVFHCLGAQRAKIGACIRFGEHGCG